MAVSLVLLAALVGTVVNGRPKLTQENSTEVTELSNAIDSVPEEEQKLLEVKHTVQCLMTLEVVYSVEEGKLPYPLCYSRCSGGEQLWGDGVAFKRLPELKPYGLMVEKTVRNGSLQGCRMVPYESVEESAARQETQKTCVELYFSTDKAFEDQPEVLSLTERIPIHRTTLPIHKRLEGFTRVGDSHYMVSPGVMTWQEGMDYCDQFGAVMAVIESVREHELLKGVLSTDVWTGVTRNRDSIWTWGDLTFKDVGGDCGVLKRQDNYGMNFSPCGGASRVLCQHPLEDDPHQYRCPAGYLKHKSSCYLTSTKYDTYSSGEELCLSKGGYPAFINSLEEAEFIEPLATKEGRLFLGYTDTETEGTFVSKRFGPPLITRWAPNEPNNVLQDNHDEDCLEIDIVHNNRWVDVRCFMTYRIVCEFSAEIAD